MKKREIKSVIEGLKAVKIAKLEDKAMRTSVFKTFMRLLGLQKQYESDFEDMRTVFLSAHKGEQEKVADLQQKLNMESDRAKQVELAKEINSHADYLAAGWDTPYKEITFRLTSQSMSVYAYGVWNSAHTQIQFFVEAFNEDSIAKTISVQIILRRNQNGAVEPTSETTLATYPTTLQLTVPAGGSVRYPAGDALLSWTPGVAYSDNYFYWLGSVVSGYTTHFVQIEEDPGVMPE
jgi:hypothetical protein